MSISNVSRLVDCLSGPPNLRAALLPANRQALRAYYVNVFREVPMRKDLMTERDPLHRLPRLTTVELISWRAIMSSPCAVMLFLEGARGGRRGVEFSQSNQERRESRKRIIALGSFTPSRSWHYEISSREGIVLRFPRNRFTAAACLMMKDDCSGGH